jgi:hypothetical protein
MIGDVADARHLAAAVLEGDRVSAELRHALEDRRVRLAANFVVTHPVHPR